MKQFRELLHTAIQDLLTHGYDSKARLDEWLIRLAAAARQALVPEREVQARLVAALGTVFERHINSRKFLERHKSLSQYQIEHVKPSLRHELNRRILASADLIRLNRQASIERTLQRFAGWATSIPSGGTRSELQRPLDQKLYRSFASLPFEERRVIIDQGHKLVSAVNSIVAEDGGAIAAIWHSHWRETGYDYRPRHKQFDERVFVIRDNWAMRDGLMKLSGRFYTDQIEQTAQEPFCFPGDSQIQFADRVDLAYRRWYSGKLAVVVSSSGKTLRATPNHPVLTLCGWKQIGSLQTGDYLVEIAENGVSAAEYQNNGIPLISDVFKALEKTSIIQSFNLSSAAFHGDGIADSQVDIVSAARSLSIDWQVSREKSLKQFCLAVAARCTSGLCDIGAALFGMWLTTKKLVGGICESLSTLFSQAVHSNGTCLGNAARAYAGISQPPIDGDPGYAEFPGKSEYAISRLEGINQLFGIQEKSRFILRQPGLSQFEKPTIGSGGGYTEYVGEFLQSLSFRAQFSKVISVELNSWSGHVYNLQTENGWYVAEGIIVHNCRCFYQYRYGLSDLPRDMLTAKGKEALLSGRQRAA